MRILEINNTDLFSTGRIMLNIAQKAREKGHNVLTASKYCKMSIDRHREDLNHIYIGNRIGNTIHRYWAWMTDLQDTGSFFSTKNFLKKVDWFNPDIIHLHDILGWYLNIDILFDFIKKHNIPVVWTFHDCWAFTGRCIHFDAARCNRWKNGCGNCPQIHYMPRTWWFDLSHWNFERKRKLFTSVNNMTIVTPSQWLANLTAQSFLQNYSVNVINNGIDLNLFKPTQGDIYRRLKVDGKKIILGVAGTWTERKGIDDFIKLANTISPEKKIVLVGIEQSALPSQCNIEAIARTHNQAELAEIYTAADVFVNPTYEDNFPTVNLESLACGTPIVTYRTGGSPESVDTSVGLVVEQGNRAALVSAIDEILINKDKYTQEACLNQSLRYDMNARFDDYVSLLETVASQR
jgi:glycosyltransferase involved in cell wall biosynthesis